MGQTQVEKGSVEQMEFSRNSKFLREIAGMLRKLGITDYVEIGDGLLAIWWPDGESFDIYFDTGRWKLAVKIEDRFKEVVFPPELRNTGVITTYFLKREMTNPEVVKIIAKLMLVPTASHYRLVSEK